VTAPDPAAYFPPESTGSAPGRGRLAGRRILVDTPLGRDASRHNPARTARRLPFGRQATAWVAYATVWLLSSEASYVNAHPLVLDGGAVGIA